MRNVLVTGGLGFIGSHLVRVLLDKPVNKVVNLDSGTYAANNPSSLGRTSGGRYILVRADIREREVVRKVIEKHLIDTVFHLAAETHVDRSIENGALFSNVNMYGTHVLLEEIMEKYIHFVYISTDEVYGENDYEVDEWAVFKPGNPYSASKAGADLLVQACVNTYGLDATIIRPCNQYGPYQNKEKFIPTVITNALANKPIPIYGDGQQRRTWAYVEDTAHNIVQLALLGKNKIFNLGSKDVLTNLEITEAACELLGRDKSLIEHVEDRPGHDTCYMIDSTRARKALAGFLFQRPFRLGLDRTIQWYSKNQRWTHGMPYGKKHGDPLREVLSRAHTRSYTQ